MLYRLHRGLCAVQATQGGCALYRLHRGLCAQQETIAAVCYTGYTWGLCDIQATQRGCVFHRLHVGDVCYSCNTGGLRAMQAAPSSTVCYTGYTGGCVRHRLHKGYVCYTSYTEGLL